MDVLEHFAQAAAVLLLLELIVLVVILLGVTGGLAFGLRWVNGKTGWAFGLVNTYTNLGRKYLRKGTDYAALPMILMGRYSDTAKGTVDAIRERVRSIRASRTAQPPVAARPVAAPTVEHQSTDVLV